MHSYNNPQLIIVSIEIYYHIQIKSLISTNLFTHKNVKTTANIKCFTVDLFIEIKIDSKIYLAHNI